MIEMTGKLGRRRQ